MQKEQNVEPSHFFLKLGRRDEGKINLSQSHSKIGSNIAQGNNTLDHRTPGYQALQTNCCPGRMHISPLLLGMAS
jgi:hypothetical protein